MTTQAAIKRYHEWICGRPCMHCSVEGFTQTSHYEGLSGYKFGRGGSVKAHDIVVCGLCCDRPDKKGCHALFDDNEMLTVTEDEFMQKIDFSERHLAWCMQTIIAAVNAGVINLV